MSDFEWDFKWVDDGYAKDFDNSEDIEDFLKQWKNSIKQTELEGLELFDKGSSDGLDGEHSVGNKKSPSINYSHALHSLKISEQKKLAPQKEVCDKRSRNPSMSKKVPPQAYNFMNIYSERKDQLIRQQKEQERKQREFRSRPVPDFRLVHERQAIKVVVHRVTHPVTPNVLKNSLEMEAKRRQRVEQLRKERHLEDQSHRLQAPKAKAVPQSSRRPLKPENRRSHISVLKVEPFNLSTELRAQRRRIYNEETSRMLEARRRELEEERQRAEREAYLKQRQLTSFRAKPNPFAVPSR